MDRAIQVLRTLAIVTLIISIAIVLYQLPALSSTFTFTSYSSFYSPFNEFAWVTCSMLGFATGIVALVLAAQRHHQRWFVLLLVLTVLTPYASLLVAFALPRIILDAPSFDVYLRFEVLSYTALPFVTALAVLAYTLRSRRRQPITPAPAEDTDLEIEYTRLS